MSDCDRPNLPPCLRSFALRQLEMQHAHLQPPLMERAGQAAADWLLPRLQTGDRLLLLAGPGNNGGDALVMARHLHQRGVPLHLVWLGEEAQLPGDAAAALQQLRAAGCPLHTGLPPAQQWDWAVDGLFGIGLQRPLQGQYAEAVNYLHLHARHILALDIPSGLQADTGYPTGPAVHAQHTLTFLSDKPGLWTGAGRDHTGEVCIAPLLDDLSVTDGWRLDQLTTRLPARPHDSHKGRFGRVGIIGGAAGMQGAALLAGRAALQLGAGRVWLGGLSPLPLDVSHLQLMQQTADTLCTQALEALVVGPGMGQEHAALPLLQQSLHSTAPLLLDADALTLLGAHPALHTTVQQRPAPTLLTPHPLEAARLLGCTVADIQADRIRHALQLAVQFRAWVVLKGAGSIVASPDGQWWVNGSGNPGLAVAGMGDVLAGMVAALLAQGMAAGEALLGAVWLHGAAADDAVAQLGGPIGLSCDEVITAARSRLNRACC